MEANKIKKIADQMDCIFYVLVDSNLSKGRPVKQEVQSKICDRFAEALDVDFYCIRSGKDVESVEGLANEWSHLVPEQVQIVAIDVEGDDVSLLSQEQRDMAFELAVSGTFKGCNSMDLVKHALNGTQGSACSIPEKL